MALSTMQEILVLLEDEKEVPLFRLNRWGRGARGTLSKLKNLGWAKKNIKDDENYYSITDRGENYFDETLKVLKLPNKWDGKWRLVLFDIPENRRASRDKLRRSLNSLGMGILQASVWISPLDIGKDVEVISQRLKLENNIKYFIVTANTSLNEQIIQKAWNNKEVVFKLERFIKDADWAMKKMGKGNGDRYIAKKLIFEYALILKNDPQLPLVFIEKNEIRKKAREVYNKLRKYII